MMRMRTEDERVMAKKKALVLKIEMGFGLKGLEGMMNFL